MQERDLSIARNLRERLQGIVPIQRMVIYGSRARDDASAESDMDVFIEVLSITPEQRVRIREVAWEVSLENEVLITTFVATSNSLIYGPLRANPILKSIEAEGITV